MASQHAWQLQELPREGLEDLAFKTVAERRSMKHEQASNAFFFAIALAFLAGAALAAAGFVTGALLH